MRIAAGLEDVRLTTNLRCSLVEPHMRRPVPAAVGGETPVMTFKDGSSRSFAVVLGGGGARGLAHAGVLRALEHYGWRPSAIVGVSMGAVVGAAYALREDWYSAVLDFADSAFPEVLPQVATGSHGGTSKLRELVAGAKTVWDLRRGWGASAGDVRVGRDALDRLLGGKDLLGGRVPVVVTATDLLSGDRVVLSDGPAVDAAYASAALAGVLPPQPVGSRLLADGAYTDICPIDVARQLGCDHVVAVNPGRSDLVADIHNGLQALMRATEICYLHHAALRFEQADIVISPPFRRTVDTLDFGASRECVAAGVRAVRERAPELSKILTA
jgi:NTE family protein